MNQFANHSLLAALALAAGLAAHAQSAATGPLDVQFWGGPSGGALISKAAAEEHIQSREDRLKPTDLRQDFKANPMAASGWVFSRKLLLELLQRMRDKDDNAKIYFTLGHATRHTENFVPVPGSWRETLVISDAQPFSADATESAVYAQYPNAWP